MNVSAVVPVRDGRRYLGEALASLLAQRTPPSENAQRTPLHRQTSPSRTRLDLTLKPG